jgi:hypothetical protein
MCIVTVNSIAQNKTCVPIPSHFWSNQVRGAPKSLPEICHFGGRTHQKRLGKMVNLNLPVPPDNKHDQNMPNSLENREKRLIVGSRSVLEVGSNCQFHGRTGKFWQGQVMRKAKTGTCWRFSRHQSAPAGVLRRRQ